MVLSTIWNGLETASNEPQECSRNMLRNTPSRSLVFQLCTLLHYWGSLLEVSTKVPLSTSTLTLAGRDLRASEGTRLHLGVCLLLWRGQIEMLLLRLFVFLASLGVQRGFRIGTIEVLIKDPFRLGVPCGRNHPLS